MINENQMKLINVLENCAGIDKYNSSLSILKHENELKDKLIEIAKKSTEDTQSVINDFKQELDLTYLQKKDPLLDKIISIIGDKVSKEFTNEELDEIYLKGKERFEKRIPPGYKDNDKENNDKYSDLVIWLELQKLSKELDKNILFISDDRKEDWAHKFKGKDLGPRNELIKEFIKETNNLFYSITTKRFIEIISDIHSISDTELLIQETENIQKSIYEKEQLQKELFRLKLGQENIRKKKFKDNMDYFKWINYDSDYISQKPMDLDNSKDNLKEIKYWNENDLNKIKEFDDYNDEEMKKRIIKFRLEERVKKYLLNMKNIEKSNDDDIDSNFVDE